MKEMSDVHLFHLCREKEAIRQAHLLLIRLHINKKASIPLCEPSSNLLFRPP